MKVTHRVYSRSALLLIERDDDHSGHEQGASPPDGGKCARVKLLNPATFNVLRRSGRRSALTRVRRPCRL